MTGTTSRPGFGMPGSVTSDAIRQLPKAMQVEGILLLEEMGLTSVEVAIHSGFSASKRRELIATVRPYRGKEPAGGEA
ncbi:MAG TPA: hypothetical protein VGV39_15165 [Mesorhizobium sp.]|jgi:hypothetical protein|uniref:hypothetical protein n=1 Tax=Mesorhizobium sp. TaxID=1871066 RepID=UPI002DDD6279|nr:hypothetical protein [Mesorhizobium sp.]HEV2504417.1 hypothetical protein [Mesorhizobium sp.]